jgi:hypothetical protein
MRSYFGAAVSPMLGLSPTASVNVTASKPTGGAVQSDDRRDRSDRREAPEVRTYFGGRMAPFLWSACIRLPSGPRCATSRQGPGGPAVPWPDCRSCTWSRSVSDPMPRSVIGAEPVLSRDSRSSSILASRIFSGCMKPASTCGSTGYRCHPHPLPSPRTMRIRFGMHLDCSVSRNVVRSGCTCAAATPCRKPRLRRLDGSSARGPEDRRGMSHRRRRSASETTGARIHPSGSIPVAAATRGYGHAGPGRARAVSNHGGCKRTGPPRPRRQARRW